MTFRQKTSTTPIVKVGEWVSYCDDDRAIARAQVCGIDEDGDVHLTVYTQVGGEMHVAYGIPKAVAASTPEERAVAGRWFK